MSEEEVVVVTGGAGFLGQHIVKHLLEQKEFPIREVRVFDIMPVKWIYGLEGEDTGVPLHQYQGDICNQVDLQEAFGGATVVIHNASVVDVSSNPDMDRIEKVNVHGTENVIKCCINNNIEKLLYTSTAGVADNLKHLGAYGTTKKKAEDRILEANGNILPNGRVFRSCAFRPVGVYGEGALTTIDFLDKMVWGNTFIKLGDDASVAPMVYAGNIAGAFVAALCRMRNTSKDANELPSPDGLAISLADDTPLTSHGRFMEPICGRVFSAKASRFYVPFWVMLFAAHFFEWFSYLMKPFFRINFPLSKFSVTCMYSLPIPRADEPLKYLGYVPLYSYETALARSVEYCKYVCNKK